MSLKMKVNPFGGVVVLPESLPGTPDELFASLKGLIVEWQLAGHSLVWLELPTPLAALVPVAVELGFDNLATRSPSG